ncbi:hypothetical protein CPB83DRAFT_893389 [Crepidotus variabilis]|uniref:Nephrocystin 3-like N-terminal domain-containing protein n=1 Tax=Crepidotus variabilis TaxID=179855 RepID=A0A9P6EI80_9AGAR|nr:hypothetical protein CPB83DRAFT_893389 [Crepidotus variabilis]
MAYITEFFTNASSVNLDNCNFTNIQHADLALSNEPITGSPAKLYRRSAPGAFLNSAERGNPPRCSPRTRLKLLLETKGFATESKPTPSAMWIVGSAGSGKTALAQSTAEQLKVGGHVLGCHFFLRTSKDGKRGDGHCWVPGLVHQMIRTLPQIRPFVERAIRHNDSVFDQQPEAVLDELFLQPLLKAVAEEQRRTYSLRGVFDWIFGKRKRFPKLHLPRLIVVDGLDECSSPEMQEHIIKTIARIIPKIPIPLRFLIASRPETHIRTTINREFQNVYLHRINLDEDQDARKDVEQYFIDRFEDIRVNHPWLEYQSGYDSWPSQEDIAALVEKSSLVFIFANTVMNYVGHRSGHPVERLEVILGLAIVPDKDKPYLPLDTLYRFILSTVKEENRALVGEILCILYLAGKAGFGNLQLDASPIFLELLLGLRAGKVFSLLDPLVSLLTLPKTATGTITVLHASFFDYLVDPARSGELILPVDDFCNLLQSEEIAVKIRHTHEIIAIKVFNETEASDSWELEDSATLNSNALDLFIHHAIRAHMSLDLLFKLYTLQDRMMFMAFHYDEQTHWDEFQIFVPLICSVLNGLPKSSILIGDRISEASWKQHRRDMASLVVQFTCENTEEDALSSLIAQLQAGVKNSTSNDLRLCAKPNINSCVPLIQDLMMTQRKRLHRGDFFQLLSTSEMIHVASRDFAREVVIFLNAVKRITPARMSNEMSQLDTLLLRWRPYA